MTALNRANIEVLGQLKELLTCCHSLYCRVHGSSVAGIGEHVRHVLDHYRAFQAGMVSDCIDYNYRTRNSIEETDPLIALQHIDGLIEWLAGNALMPATIQVISEINLQDSQSETMLSTPARELLYLINHSIHHMAYAALLAKTNGITVPAYIGLAPSTVNFHRSTQERHSYASN
ncbi:DinB family protein [Reinekea sp.]|jgi:uncharacterized damage-inducible protein DinB|uniref:DinB family protein n=1 Tax=Reinekea sp. TaxID=1970455 RepID=UPI002A7F309C|nr:DinB family protein [Reinekea sp.]